MWEQGGCPRVDKDAHIAGRSRRGREMAEVAMGSAMRIRDEGELGLWWISRGGSLGHVGGQAVLFEDRDELGTDVEGALDA